MRHICLFLALAIAIPTQSQHVHFTQNGVIEYEKTINVHALLKREMAVANSPLFDQIIIDRISKLPQFVKLKSTLSFTSTQALFVPEGGQQKLNYLNNPATEQINTISINYEQKTITSQKKVVDEFYILKDSLRNITWKITDEYRDIVGYPCRRANAIIMDSIYVVAFYTEEIAVSGGPESFSGLPGMILGVALPHEHVSWFATKVLEVPVTTGNLKVPTKGEPITKEQLTDILKRVSARGWLMPPRMKDFML